MKKHSLLVFFLALMPALLFAQFPTGGRPAGQPNAAQFNIGHFYGKVLDDATGKPLAYASVQLLGMRWDSVSRSMKEAILGGQLTEENGDFSLENLPIRGEFTLKIIYLGYASYEKKVSFGAPRAGSAPTPAGGRPNGGGGGNLGAMAGAVDKDLGNIRLAASSQMLQEVEIKGEASHVQLALDKKIYRVDKDNIAAGGTAEDALKNVPSLNVDIDGNLTMRNAAPQLFVDGRPTNLTLDQIPADAIDNVEVITNPSAKYDASGGGAGIVNIVLKKDRKVGYNGNIRAGVDMRGRLNLGGDINARERKVNAFVSGNFNQRRSLGSGGTDRYNTQGQEVLTNVFQDTKSENTGFFAMGRAGFDWFIDNRNTFTISGNFNGGNFNSTDDLNIRTDVPSLSTSSFSTRNSENERMYRNYGSQALFKHLFPKEGKEWTADLNFNGSRSESKGNFVTSYQTPPRPANNQRQEGKGSNEFLTFQTDFVNPLGSGLKIETGVRAAVRNYRSENATYQNDVRTPGFADRYKFNDQVYAAYGTFSQSFKKWGYQTGLRAERSQYTGTLLDTDSTFGIDYPLQLFPSAFLTYKLNEADNLQLSFTRRINRPNFFQLIPFPDFSDSLQLSRGNPNLRPEFANSLELTYQNIFSKGHNLLVSAYYKRSSNLVTRYLFQEFDPVRDDTIIVSTFQNANSSTAYGVEFTLKNTFWKILELTTNLNLYNALVDATNVQSKLENEQFTYFIKENLSLKLPKNFTVQFNGSYQSRTAFSLESGGGGGGRGGGGGGGGWGGTSNTAQGYTIPVWFVDFSIRKDLWNKKASLTLNIQDILRTRRNGSHTESAFFVQDSWRRRDPQLARLNFSYRFGKFDVSLFKRKNTRLETEGMDF